MNTIRILTALSTDGKIEFVSAVFRSGANNNVRVDNWSNGGLSCNINLITGVLGKGVTFPDRSGRLVWHSTHPNSGFKLENFVIPMWDKIISDIEQLAQSLIFLPYIGWDIVPMENNYLILEANSNSDLNLLQVHGSLLRTERIRQFYSSHKLI